MMIDNLIREKIKEEFTTVLSCVPAEKYESVLEAVLNLYQRTSDSCTEAFEDYLAARGNEQYNLGFKEGYGQREAEYGSEQSDNDQASWERGYQDGIMDSSL